MTSDKHSIFDEDIRLDKAYEFFDLFLKGKNIFHPNHLFDVTETTINDYIYRGHASTNWALTAKVQRSSEALSEFTPQPPSTRRLEKGDLFNYLKTHLHAELRSIQLFHEAADKAGIKTEFNYYLDGEHDSVLNLDPAKHSTTELDRFPISEYLHVMALAQHHGIPTRLLDWTSSPFIAAYFAAEGAMQNQENTNFKDEFCIFALSKVLLRQTKNIEIVRVPYGDNDYLRSQRGTFTLIRNSNSYFIENGKWPSLEEVITEERKTNTLYMRQPFVRIRLPVSEAKELLKLLYIIDISPATMMPSLATAASELHYKMKLWKDIK